MISDFHYSEQGMNSLSLQLESTQNSSNMIREMEKRLQATENEYQECQRDLGSSKEELAKLKSEKKLLLKHDQVF